MEDQQHLHVILEEVVEEQVKKDLEVQIQTMEVMVVMDQLHQ